MTCPHCGAAYRPGHSIMNHLVYKAAHFTGCSVEELRGPCRERRLAHIRYAVSFTAKRKGLHLKQIGRGLGNRDHSTILNGLRNADWLIQNDQKFATLVADLQATVEAA